MTTDIRFATAGDEAAWRPLWAAYLTFYKADVSEEITRHTWQRILDPQSRVAMRLAIVDGAIAGFAIHHHHDSTWDVRPDCYLEDLFVSEAVRGRGVGRALIDDLHALCRTRGWGRLYWHTNADNARARALYDTYAPADGFVRYTLPVGE
jgi:GNAT superfamily N-acetyltransferase